MADRGLTKKQREHEDAVRSHEFRLALLGKIAPFCYILSSAIPIYSIHLCLNDMAGKATSVGVVFNSTILLSGTGFAAVTAIFKMLSQKAELKRLRARVLEYEKAALKPKATTAADRE